MQFLKRKTKKMASYKVTDGMVAEAKKALAWRREHGRGGTAVGIARARDIANRKNLSESTVKRMYSYFSRHEVDKKAKGFRPGEKGFPSNGRIAWAMWGGDPGFSWSRKIVNQLKKEEERAIEGPLRKALQKKVEDHNEEHGGDKRKKTNLRTLSVVFERGVGAYKSNPGSVRPGVSSPEQWGLARVNSFLYALRNLRFRRKKHDTDLLPKDHPLSSKEKDDRIANMDTQERHIKDIRETEDSVIVEFGKSMPEPDNNEEENSYHDEDERPGDHNENEERAEDFCMEDFYGDESLQRAFEFNQNKINDEERTVEIGVSSELPVERKFGLEVLGHNENEVNLEFMKSGRAPLLMDHDHTKQIGVVTNFGIDEQNKRTIATVKFSKSEKAQEVYEDVKAGIRQNISVGYQVSEMKKEEDRDGLPTYRVTNWTPLEVSAVSVPADQSALVGFARSKNAKNVNIKIAERQEKKMENIDNVETKTPEVNADALRADFAKEAKAIIDLGVKHNKRDLANEAIANNVSLAQFRGQLLETLANDKPLDIPSNVDMNVQEKREYSLIKAIRETAAGNLTGLEREVSDEIASRTGKSARGFYMPTNLEFGQRDQTVGTNSQGGFLKPTDHMGSEFIEALKAKLVIGQAGARVMSGLVGDVAIPKMSSEVSNASFVAENAAPSEGAATFAQVTMSPKTLAAYVDVSRKLMMQSDPSVENLLRQDVLNTFARKIDEVAIEGGASNEPSGIIASSTGNVVAIGTNGGAVSYSKIVDMIEAVEVDNAILNDASVKFLGNPKVTANLRTIGKQASGVEGNFILGEDQRILGYDYLSSTLVPSDLTKGTGTALSAMIFGDFSQLLLGFYSGVDVVVDPYTGSSAGTTRLAFFQDCDVALRHNDAFSVIKDITT